MNTRLLGTLCIVGSFAVLVDGFRLTVLGLENLDRVSSLAYMLWSIGGICAIVGLIKLNALGSNTVMRALAFLAHVG